MPTKDEDGFRTMLSCGLDDHGRLVCEIELLPSTAEGAAKLMTDLTRHVIDCLADHLGKERRPMAQAVWAHMFAEAAKAPMSSTGEPVRAMPIPGWNPKSSGDES